MSNKHLLHIENLDCPVCAQALQEDLQKIKGVEYVSVDYVTQTITLQTSEEKALQKVIATTNKFEEVRVLDGGRYATKQKNSHLKEWLFIAISTAFFLFGILLDEFGHGLPIQIIAYCAYAAAYLSVGYPVLISTVKNVAKGRIFDENFLMTIASLGAIVLREYSEAVLVMLLYQLGELLQTIAVGSSRQSVAKLMELKSERATILNGDTQTECSPEEVKIGDILLIKAGEKVPVDAILLEEMASFDTKSLTGEPVPKDIKQGDEVLSGYINVGSVCKVRAIRAYTDSAVGRILQMVENAAEGKAAPEKFISKFARIYTPVVCLLAVGIAVFAPLIHGFVAGKGFAFYNPLRWLQSALTFLVISCPCALIISVPLTYFSGIGTCAKNGILVKGATYLDVAAKAKTIAFDKTGTLTKGEFSVQGVYPAKDNNADLLAITVAVEKLSSHPIAKAFVDMSTELKAEDVEEIAGKGLIAKIDGERVLVGNAALLTDKGVAFQARVSNHTVIYVAKEGVFQGAIEVGDTLREGVKESMEKIKRLGFKRITMLTGDNRIRAEKIANEVGMYELNADLLPDDKLKIAQNLKEDGGLIYVGDGINDAPVMVTADCAVSMGKLGSAAAIEASDFVLISDDISALPKGICIARKTRKIVMQNIIFSIGMKLGFMALGLMGWLPLWLAVFADVGVMLLAVLNSFRVRFLKNK